MNRRTIPASLLLIVLLLSSQLSALASPGILDQQQEQTSGVSPVYEGRALVQTFTAGRDGLLTGVSLALDAPFSKLVTVEIRSTDTNGQPTGSFSEGSGEVLASQTVGVVGGRWYDISFDTPPQVGSGNLYAIVVTSPGEPDDYPVNWLLSPMNAYDGGALGRFDEFDFPFWMMFENGDFAFKTYVLEASRISYSFGGFAAPVNPDALNIAKSGQTIPLKFRVTDDIGNPVSGLTLAAVTLGSVAMACNGSAGAPDELDYYTTSKSGWQDQGDGYYQYNWATQKNWSGTCRQLQVDLGDGTIHTVDFQFKK